MYGGKYGNVNGLGFFSFLFLTAFGGGWTVPLGLPPAKEDHALARVAPEKCLFYASWTSRATADAKSKNQTEQLLAEPEVQRSIAVLGTFTSETILPKLASGEPIGRLGDPARRPQEAIYTSGSQRPAQDGPEPGAKVQDAVQRFVTDFAAIAVTHPGAIYFDNAFPLLVTSYVGEPKLDKQAPQQEVRGGMVVAAGPQAEKLRESFDQFLKQLKAAALPQVKKEVQIAGRTWYRFPGIKDRKDQPPMICGFQGTNFIVGAGDGSVEGILARSQQEPPAWLVDLRKQLPVERVSTVLYLNTKRLLARALSRRRADAEDVGCRAEAGPRQYYRRKFGIRSGRRDIHQQAFAFHRRRAARHPPRVFGQAVAGRRYKAHPGRLDALAGDAF